MAPPFQHQACQEPLIEAVHGLNIHERSDFRRAMACQRSSQRCKTRSHAQDPLSWINPAILSLRWFRLYGSSSIGQTVCHQTQEDDHCPTLDYHAHTLLGSVMTWLR